MLNISKNKNISLKTKGLLSIIKDNFKVSEDKKSLLLLSNIKQFTSNSNKTIFSCLRELEYFGVITINEIKEITFSKDFMITITINAR